jgi:hypothetical protein
MTPENFYILQIISTFSVLPALLLGLFFFNKIPLLPKYFLGFLLIGFMIDLLGWYFYLTKYADGHTYFRYAYNLFEPLFLCGFLGELLPKNKLRIFCHWAWILIFPFWLLSIFYPGLYAMYKISTEVFIAFVSSFCLLSLVEKEISWIQMPVFWILIGIFFYNFSTFFFMGLSTTDLGNRLWFMHNIINVTTYLFFMVAYSIYYKKQNLKLTVDR